MDLEDGEECPVCIPPSPLLDDTETDNSAGIMVQPDESEEEAATS